MPVRAPWARTGTRGSIDPVSGRGRRRGRRGRRSSTGLCRRRRLFDDTGELMPDRQIIAPHRPTGLTGAAA
ncbi:MULTISPECIES: DUF5999 family protein [unclassified Streptomyces]|uniref:DUF5999 family protein n=1 Tax=unclassified Streptomyces TaxID=2593676 RepID=UPI002DD8BD8E|nr:MULTISPECIES: DUF5999 family protein [unclassified Streptomyces]WSD29644.1 DUF5999 family protein [Streptomyces sp. NBC_01751]WSF82015.1 DUF5999 family protein [Streptomyces sp. NBC_01744]WSJ48489.1 DUF5999 family protein [Streptomyces sp. NBC_01318]